MGHDREKETDQENYRFLNETIKEKPGKKSSIIKKIAVIMGSGMLFGCCAAVSCIGMFRILPEPFGLEMIPKENLRIASSSPEPSETAVSAEWLEETISENSFSLLDRYEDIYKEVLRISQNARKALVTVQGVSADQDLLDDTLLTYTSREGVIFWETEASIYILACGNLHDYAENIDDVEITFADGTVVGGTICKADSQTGLLVAKIEKNQLSTETIESLSVLDLGKNTSMPKLRSVIAIGSPAGDKDAVVYGMITSVSGRFQVADAEYNILATDMHGSEDGSGVLLDTSGNAVGIIVNPEEDSNNTIRALPVSQLYALIKKLANETPINYTGIYGTGVTRSQAAMKNIPQGVYVENIDMDSPAMTAGILCGDIIRYVNEERVTDMESYNKILQKLEVGEEAVFAVSRISTEGRYIEREFIIKIDER